MRTAQEQLILMVSWSLQDFGWTYRLCIWNDINNFFLCFCYYRIYGYDDGIGINSEEYQPASYHDHSQFWQWFRFVFSNVGGTYQKYIAYPTNKSIHVVNFKITSKIQIFQYLKLFPFFYDVGCQTFL